MLTLNEIKGDFTQISVTIRILGLILFKFIHPFPASILNESIDSWDIPLNNLNLNSKVDVGLKYQIPDKILDYILYTSWLIIPIIQKKWFVPLLVGAIIFRSIGMYYFLKTKQDDNLTKYPNIFLYWFFLLYGLEYFNIKVSNTTMVILLTIAYFLKVLHEHVLRGKFSKSYFDSTDLITEKIKLPKLTLFILITIMWGLLLKGLPSEKFFNPAI